jgi:hypothetical protein
VVPLIVSEAALLTVQFSVVLSPLVMELFAAVKLEITGAGAGFELPPQPEAIVTATAARKKNTLEQRRWRGWKYDRNAFVSQCAFIAVITFEGRAAASSTLLMDVKGWPCAAASREYPESGK